MNSHFYKNYFQVEKTHWLMRVRRMIVGDLLCRYLDPQTGDVKILDFGCGSGILVGELQGRGYNAFGVDVSDEAVEFGRMQGVKNLDIQSGEFLGYPNDYFDAVLSMDVLEHLEDESWAIKEISRVAKPQGRVIVTVPAYKFLWGIQDEVAHHYRRYNLAEIKQRLVSDGQLKIIWATYFNTLLFPLIALFRLFSRFFGWSGRQSDFDINTPLLDKIFFRLFNLERWLLRIVRFPYGVSILIVLEKNNP